MRVIRWPVLALSILVLVACDREDRGNVAASPNGATSTADPDVAEVLAAGDGQWLNLTGRVLSSDGRGFVLDYGAGNIRVEVDDWDTMKEGLLLKAGDAVTVSGLADSDLFMKKRIEAQSVFVHNLNAIVYASGADEESMVGRAAAMATPQDYSDFTGIVSAIEGREFTLGTGRTAIRVDTSQLAANPLDSQGVQQVKVGDRVLVWGDVDLERAENAEIKARGLISMLRSGAGVRAATPAPAPSAPGDVGNANGAAAEGNANSAAAEGNAN